MAKCPYCDKPVVMKANNKSDKQNEIKRESAGIFTKETMYSCPHCEKVLSIKRWWG